MYNNNNNNNNNNMNKLKHLIKNVFFQTVDFQYVHQW